MSPEKLETLNKGSNTMELNEISFSTGPDRICRLCSVYMYIWISTKLKCVKCAVAACTIDLLE